MGRRPQGYTLRQHAKTGVWCVRFRIDGTRYEYSTRERDRSAAEREARAIYAAALHGQPQRRGNAVATLTVEVLSSWLDSLELRATTRELYEKYTVYWARARLRLDDAAIAAYQRRRLREVRGKTVRHESSALRRCVRWLTETGLLEEPPTVPRVPGSSLGTPYTERRRCAAPEYSTEEVRAVLRALPEKSQTGFWVRPRCELLYETGLRPSTVDALSVPEHWAPGSTTLRVTDEIDKEGFARELPLTARALWILRRCAPECGVIFGRHLFPEFVRAAATEALSPAKARVFTPQHLRSARATHLLDEGAPLPGVQFLLGHRWTSTTARYVRPSRRAAEAALASVAPAVRGKVRGKPKAVRAKSRGKRRATR